VIEHYREEATRGLIRLLVVRSRLGRLDEERKKLSKQESSLVEGLKRCLGRRCDIDALVQEVREALQEISEEDRKEPE